MKHLTIIILLMLGLNACAPVGENGLATINGYVKTDLYSKTSGALLTSYMSPDERVYIIYGDGTIFDDDTQTNFDGKYRFNLLSQGNYQLAAYSECQFNLNTCPSELELVQLEIEIVSRKDELTADTLIIKKFD